jgi:hypothetical protein
LAEQYPINRPEQRISPSITNVVSLYPLLLLFSFVAATFSSREMMSFCSCPILLRVLDAANRFKTAVSIDWPHREWLEGVSADLHISKTHYFIFWAVYNR